METVTHGRVQVVLPYLEDDPRTVASLPGIGTLTGYRYADHQVRQLTITQAHLSNGSMSCIDAQRVTLDRVRIESAHIEECVWASADVTDSTLTRVVFRRCKILGAQFTNNKWANVIFDGCRIDYTDFDTIRATGPVVFTNTTLKDVTFTDCVFPDGVLTDCDLHAVEFSSGNYAGVDLRGTDLTTVRGAANLNGALITPDQRHQLAEALVTELDLRYPEDKP